MDAIYQASPRLEDADGQLFVVKSTLRNINL
jgi:hypothetical protein